MKMSLTIIFLVAVAILVILLLVEVYLVVTVVSSGRQPASGSMATSDGRYRFSWTIANGEITVAFAVRTNPGTWAAVGFSEDKLMSNTDVIIGGVNGVGLSFVEDRWITDGKTTANVVYDDIQDISFASATRTDGILTVTFSRPLNTNDPMDVPMDGYENSCVYVLWAYGGMVGDFSTTPKSGLTGHTANGIFPKQLCGCTSIVMSLGILLLGALIATFATY